MGSESDDFEIFDEETSERIEKEIEQGLDEAAVSLGLEAIELKGGSHRKEEDTSDVPLDKRKGRVLTVEPEIGIHTFQDTIADLEIRGHLVILDRSCYVWVAMAEGPGQQGALVTAMKTKYENIPTVSVLQAGVGESFSPGMAQRLSKRTGMVVFASCELPDTAFNALPAIEAKVLALLSTV